MKLPEIHVHIHIHGEADPTLITGLRALADSVSVSGSKLSTALGSSATAGAPGKTKTLEENQMDPLSQAVADLTAAVEAENTVIDSAIAYIKSVPALIDAAVAADVNNGALPQNLTNINALSTKLKSETDSLSAALTANTVPAPTPVPVENPNP